MRASPCVCGGVFIEGECNRCGTAKARKNSHQRGYNKTWRRFSEAYRRDNPLCVDCAKRGKTTPSNDVHHVRKVKHYPHLQYELSNLMALCTECHRQRTARGE